HGDRGDAQGGLGDPDRQREPLGRDPPAKRRHETALPLRELRNRRRISSRDRLDVQAQGRRPRPRERGGSFGRWRLLVFPPLRSGIEPAQGSAGTLMDALRFGIYGYGKVAELHAKAIASIPGLELVAVCGRDASRRDAFAARWAMRSRASAAEMAERDRVEAVVIATPHPLHRAHSVECSE